MAIHLVTGAFGYSGKYVTERLLERGASVRTLTNSPDRPNPFCDKISVYPYNFDNPGKLAKACDGVDVLYNTYWERFSYNDAIANTIKLFNAAREAGVGRIVHVSITNPDIQSPLGYFRGKAVLETELKNTAVPYSIVRPAILFGREDILINNIAWTLRKLPVFGIFGDGQYKLQPIHVEDFANLMVQEGIADGNRVVNAVGLETYTYKALVQTIAHALGKYRVLMPVHPRLAYFVSKVIGALLRDIITTKDEISGLMSNLLYVKEAEPVGEIKLSHWVKENAATLGRTYSSELARRRCRTKAYSEL